MSDSGDTTPHKEDAMSGPSQEYIQRLMLAHEKKKAFTREYMRVYRTEHRDEVNAYKRAFYKRKKEEKTRTIE
jgi:hypothetical protein